jgi:hypothetical protein
LHKRFVSTREAYAPSSKGWTKAQVTVGENIVGEITSACAFYQVWADLMTWRTPISL